MWQENRKKLKAQQGSKDKLQSDNEYKRKFLVNNKELKVKKGKLKVIWQSENWKKKPLKEFKEKRVQSAKIFHKKDKKSFECVVENLIKRSLEMKNYLDGRELRKRKFSPSGCE